MQHNQVQVLAIGALLAAFALPVSVGQASEVTDSEASVRVEVPDKEGQPALNAEEKALADRKHELHMQVDMARLDSKDWYRLDFGINQATTMASLDDVADEMTTLIAEKQQVQPPAVTQSSSPQSERIPQESEQEKTLPNTPHAEQSAMAQRDADQAKQKGQDTSSAQTKVADKQVGTEKASDSQVTHNSANKAVTTDPETSSAPALDVTDDYDVVSAASQNVREMLPVLPHSDGVTLGLSIGLLISVVGVVIAFRR